MPNQYNSVKNWSGYLEWTPTRISYPTTEAAIQALVQTARREGRKIRLIGSGHSFTPLSVTTDNLISLDHYQGLVHVDAARQQATVRAGTKLHALGDILHGHGLALANMGDINAQSIAGAVSTGTHGTGTGFGNMSTQVVAIRLVNGHGEVVTCSATEQPELFRAAQVSIGALGIITELTLQCVPAYRLELVIDKASLAEVLATLAERNANHRNFEFYWFPNTPHVMTKTVNTTAAPPDPHSWRDYLQDIVLENYGFHLACEIAHRFPALTHAVARFAASTTSHHRKVNHSHRVFTTPRLVKFNEMEYNVPLAAYPEVQKEVVSWVNKNNTTVMFPLENRFVQGDDIFLSPAYQRDSAYVAAHVYHKADFKAYFGALEAIFLAHGGRPHWGKIHTLTQPQLRDCYPEFGTFTRLRAEQDPDGVFLSGYLQTLFGE
ncbi:MAG: FAD-binding oxidoreductase [Bacteroidetes bacterium]|nr:MAG: FAD-binding oxidoreductase [Bacteroidota bacterium]PTM09330.1 MAG: FAD-binding oxidoreductase [Bacteroidota bacterium]